MQARIARLLNVGGFIAPVLWVAAFLYSGSLRPEYSHYRQYVSELAARGTPTQHFMQVTGFVIPGLLIAGFGYILGMPARNWLVAIAACFLIVGGIAKAVAGVFPMDPCCPSAPLSAAHEIHNVAGGVYYFTLGHGCVDGDRRGAADVRASLWLVSVVFPDERRNGNRVTITAHVGGCGDVCRRRTLSACLVWHSQPVDIRMRGVDMVAASSERHRS